MFMTNIDYRTILLQLCASLSQDDHMGGAFVNVEKALQLAGINVLQPGQLGGATGIARVLGQMGVTKLNGEPINPVYEPYY